MYLSDCRDERRFWLTHELFKASIHPQKTVDLHGSECWEVWGSLLAVGTALRMELEYLGYLAELGARMAKEVVGCCWGLLGIHGASLCLLAVLAQQALGTDLTHPRGSLQLTFLKDS